MTIVEQRVPDQADTREQHIRKACLRYRPVRSGVLEILFRAEAVPRVVARATVITGDVGGLHARGLRLRGLGDRDLVAMAARRAVTLLAQPSPGRSEPADVAVSNAGGGLARLLIDEGRELAALVEVPAVYPGLLTDAEIALRGLDCPCPAGARRPRAAARIFDRWSAGRPRRATARSRRCGRSSRSRRWPSDLGRPGACSSSWACWWHRSTRRAIRRRG